MTSQVRSKSKCLTIWSIWFCRALEPYEMEISQYNNMCRVWDTSKYHPKLSLSIFKVTRSKKGQAKNFVFGRREACFKVTFSSWLRKMTLKHFWNGPNRAKIENRENTEILVNTVKNGRFRTSKYQNLFICQDIYLKFNIYRPDRVLSPIFRFLKIRKFSLICLDIIFIDYFCKIFSFQNLI